MKKTSQSPQNLVTVVNKYIRLCFISPHHLLLMAAGDPPTLLVRTRGWTEEKVVRSQAVSRNSPRCVSAAKVLSCALILFAGGPVKGAIAKVRLSTLLIGGCFSLHSSQINKKKEKQSHILVSSQSCGR